MTCLLSAALTMRTCAADVYANETGWWHDDGAGYANIPAEAAVAVLVVGAGAAETRGMI